MFAEEPTCNHTIVEEATSCVTGKLSMQWSLAEWRRPVPDEGPPTKAPRIASPSRNALPPRCQGAKLSKKIHVAHSGLSIAGNGDDKHESEPRAEGGSSKKRQDARVLMLVGAHCVEKLYVLTPLGLMNSETGSDLRSEIASLLKKAPKDILIDCRDIQFMDSSGFGSLVSALKRVREHGKQLYLCSLNSQLRMVLELTGTDGVFPIFPSRRECLEFVSNSQPAD